MSHRTLIAGLAATVIGLSAAAQADDSWYPSKFGPDDQAGKSNLMTPDRVKEAMTFMKTGKVVSLARVYESGMPLFGHRTFAVRGTSGLSGGPLGENQVTWMDDFLSTEIGQVGTQFDGLGHIGIGDKYYNGIPISDALGPTGMKKLGIEHVKPFFTKGILIDMVDFKGRPLERGEEITVADIEGALAKQGLSADAIGEGHVVLFHTGWSRHWMTDNATYNSGCPGIGVGAGQWLAQKGVAVVGADTWPVEVVPNPNPNLAFPVHQIFLTRNGIFIHENVATEQLAADKAYEFAYIFNPLAVKGATGAPGNALAVY
ncbi:MAG: cyclase family protein [Hyphomicrobiaceae bacterium]